MPEQATKTSYTRLSTWLRCPRKYRLKYLDDAVEERTSPALIFGAAVHEAAEAYFLGVRDGVIPGADEVIGIFDRAFDDSVELGEEMGVPVDWGKMKQDELRDRGHASLGKFLEKVEKDITVLDVERRFEFEIEPGRFVEGVLDLILQGESGVRVVDIKTASSSLGPDKLNFDAQPTVYLLAAEELYGQPASFEFWALIKTKTPRFTVYPVHRNDADRAELLDAIREVEAATALGVFPRRRDWQCTGCEFRDRCKGEGGVSR